jgi:hypothetical protein
MLFEKILEGRLAEIAATDDRRPTAVTGYARSCGLVPIADRAKS